MRKLTAYIPVIGITCLIAVWGCATSGETQRSLPDRYEGTSVANVYNPTISLAEYLERLPGVSVAGNGSNITVSIRGTNSFMSSNRPIFVVDGVRIGTSFPFFVNMYDVDYIKVLKDSEATAYGVDGGNGVILIETKKSNIQ